jgi:hypothetical protein
MFKSEEERDAYIAYLQDVEGGSVDGGRPQPRSERLLLTEAKNE